MTKADFISAVAEKTGISKKDTKAVVDAMLETIREALKNDDTVPFLGFGTFKVSQRAARIGHNPRTGEQIKIKASKLPVFKASPSFKEFINPPKKKPKKK